MAYPALRTQDQVISWAQQLTAQLERDRAAALGGLIVEPGITSGVATIDLRQGDTAWFELNQDITTLNIIPPRATDRQRFDWTLVLKQGAGGGHTVTWPTGFSGAPELSSEVDAVDVIDISLIKGTHFVRSVGGSAEPEAPPQRLGEQTTLDDEDATYSLAAHGLSPGFWYKDVWTQDHTLTFPAEQGLEGGIAIIRVRQEIGTGRTLTVRLEDADMHSLGSPGVYVNLPVPSGYTRILRKTGDSGPGNPTWWTDFGFFQNGAQVNHQFATQSEMEAGTVAQARSMSPQSVAQAIAALAPP